MQICLSTEVKNCGIIVIKLTNKLAWSVLEIVALYSNFIRSFKFVPQVARTLDLPLGDFFPTEANWRSSVRARICVVQGDVTGFNTGGRETTL